MGENRFSRGSGSLEMVRIRPDLQGIINLYISNIHRRI
uniref:Uncharacterized protein n=1 Tax=viral metagenome TaxID=1070528 RepID=A0A6C0BLU0_9ZZZZ